MYLNLKKIFYTFFLVLAVFIFSLQGDFYEDGNYILYAISFIEDFDLNIINQVTPDFQWMATEQFSHPTHHSIIQTPTLILLYPLERILLILFSVDGITSFYISSVLMSFICLRSGLNFSKKFLNSMGEKLSDGEFLVFFFCTVLFYFSFIKMNVIEIFSFMLSSYLLSELFFTQKRERNYLSISICSTILVTSKLTYFPLFLLCFHDVFRSNDLSKRTNILKFTVGLSTVLVSYVIYQYSHYGQIFNFGSEFSKHVSDYTLLNIWQTLRYGYFGVGGLFYTNIIFLPIFALVLSFLVVKIRRDLRFLYLLAWLMMSFFQTIFLAGPIYEDHLVGRMTLTCLPLLLLGYSLCIKKIKNLYFKAVLSFLLIGWQFYVSFTYVIKENEGHYAYALDKLVSLNSFSNIISARFAKNFDIFFENFLLFITIAIFATIISLSGTTRKLFERFCIYCSISLILLSAIDYKNSSGNGRKFLIESDRLDNTVIAKDPKGYMFVYIMDTYESLLLNSKSKKMSERLVSKRFNYFKEVKGSYSHITPEFEKALEDHNYKYKFDVFQ
ncbi:hypothetical protein [Halobacteriovorax sp. HLS]|uniref:hypothetical protein n=1 Tax=Halobacteriovorax sp. HLS TaxID=2234000 RepID=UPI000FDAA485|nr:hypothetical protein [Halobacteriovorax sp. HLS]